MLYVNVEGLFIDREDKKKSVSLDMRSGRRGYTDDYIEDYSDVGFSHFLHANVYC